MTKKEYIDISKYYPLAVTLLVATAIVMAFCFGVAVSGAEKMIRPFVEQEYPDWKITGAYHSIRSDGGSGSRLHWGVDYAVPVGTSVRAPADGEIILSKFMGNYGNVFYIKHDNGVQTVIAHVSEFVKLKGSKVTKGEIIGYSGDTGNAKGRPHVHFETLKDGVNVHPATFIF